MFKRIGVRYRARRARPLALLRPAHGAPWRSEGFTERFPFLVRSEHAADTARAPHVVLMAHGLTDIPGRRLFPAFEMVCRGKIIALSGALFELEFL